MRIVYVAAVALASVCFVDAQEIELPPIAVRATFELRQGPSAVDLFTIHLQKQIETRRTFEETVARSPWSYSPLWKYIPLGLGSSMPDPEQFFKPQYLSLENQRSDWELRKTEKQSLFNPR
ncbi:MAG TPA: hypothetical protein VGW57_02250 [Chthoniobacterales bacterium]|nr:hypothetical protein [Chthoniobacterales bacterium]